MRSQVPSNLLTFKPVSVHYDVKFLCNHCHLHVRPGISPLIPHI